MSNITLNAVVYSSTSRNSNGASTWAALAASIASAIARLTGKVNLPQGKNDGSVKWNLAIPVVASGDTACACDGDILRTYYVRVETNVPRGSTTAERTNVTEQITDLIESSQFRDSLINLIQSD